jgi:hypothetical protein
VASPAPVHVFVDGVRRQMLAADRPTSAVAGFAPFGVGAAHGFQTSLPLPAGTHTACAYGINVGTGTAGSTLLGCATLTVAASAWNPIGRLETATVSSRAVAVTGWALDPDTPTAPINVHVYVDGRATRALTANVARADIGAARPGTGNNHGFTTELTLTSGSHNVCAYGINVGSGSGNVGLGCTTVTMPAAAYNPVGALDPVTVSSGALTVDGWAFDPDVPTTPIRVDVYVDGRGVSLTADRSRSDLAAAYPEAGTAHGYSTTVPVAAGTHHVCAYAINVSAGTGNPTLGCQDVTS